MVGLQYRDQLDQVFVPTLKELAKGPESLVVITAAETLCMFGHMEHIKVLTDGLNSDNPYLLLMAARAFELLDDKPASAMQAGRQSWQRLKQEAMGMWKGYHLYAYWSLSQIYQSDGLGYQF